MPRQRAITTGLVGRVEAYARLARWLGPWADEHAAPHVHRESVTIAAKRAFDAWLYHPPGRPRGAYLIAPGLHYAGPADPRMDRFCRVLAGAGFTVLAPFLPDYTALRVVPTCFGDLEASFEALLERPEVGADQRPGVFSISFGSLPALHLAARARRADRIGGVVVFGGYASWRATIEFCLTGTIDGRPHGTRDPLNQPVVFMNLIDAVGDIAGVAAAERPALLEAWRAYVEATWGRQDMKQDGRYQQVARDHSAALPAGTRELFLIGCGAADGGAALARRALAHDPERSAFLDPGPHLREVRCPVRLVHGIDDDVIPYVESEKLGAALAPHTSASVHLTGLYGHTTRAGSGRGAAALARELRTMARILEAFVTCGSG
jgi:pimeloyl-ACP methyl ester carboxylesterase